ncbi:hypothetical protein L207DRAFT_640401 [Hyaloscypha variabilis F]|uniref:Heterokaryon incompatibility domain-containing protein n=1 Tax=Hyaloscypha variabilis (strain UAMH 11265 / GT02V1 / F) TaxID=1149755 RepID=A0A2J6R0T3_HYAVF|nr:hypothetical protein L207DRAFT_640401 [Hyaloscypha variabilis F]
MEIGSSLAAALRHLRHKRNPVTVWTDALCINQENAEEKDIQVPLMMRIYSNDTRVHAWLGPRYNESPDVVNSATAAFDFIPIVAGLLKRFDCMQRLADETSWSKACFALAEPRRRDVQPFWAAMSKTLRDAMVSMGLWNSYLSAFKTLSQVEYFQRMWVLQETGRARVLTFHYAEREAAYELFFLSLCLARPFCTSETPADLSAISPDFDSRFLSCLTARMYCNLNCNIKKVLELAYWQRPPMHQATNPRDLIYALLGLVSGPKGIKVRYNLSVDYAYISATRLLLSQGFTEILLSFKPYKPEISTEPITSEAFPSWAYDWSTRGISSFGQYAACGPTQPALSFRQFQDLESNVTMTLRGSECGYVTATSYPFSAVAKTAGFTPEVIRIGNINRQPPSAGGKQTFGEQIRWEYFQNHINVPIPDIEKLFKDSTFPIALFWIWWIKWVTALWNFALVNSYQQDDRKVLNSVLELLLRKASTDLKGGLATAGNLHDLIDPNFWSNIVPNTSQQFNTETEDGNATAEPETRLSVEVVQSLFRSAWGMRPLALDGGQLGYGPESTEPGDEIVIFYGVKAPLVVRKVDGAAYKILGPAHVCGVMQGEFMDTNPPRQKYVLI